MKSNTQTVLLTLVVVVIALLSYVVLTTREHRSLDEKVTGAMRELQDRSPAEKVRDKFDDVTR